MEYDWDGWPVKYTRRRSAATIQFFWWQRVSQGQAHRQPGRSVLQDMPSPRAHTLLKAGTISPQICMIWSSSLWRCHLRGLQAISVVNKGRMIHVYSSSHMTILGGHQYAATPTDLSSASLVVSLPACTALQLVLQASLVHLAWIFILKPWSLTASTMWILLCLDLWLSLSWILSMTLRELTAAVPAK